MFTIICGEDSVSASRYFYDLKKNFKEKEYEIYDIEPSKIDEIILWRNDSQSLFANKKAFFIQNLNKKISKKNLSQLKNVNKLINIKDIEIISYEEEIPARFLKFGENAKIKEFKMN